MSPFSLLDVTMAQRDITMTLRDITVALHDITIALHDVICKARGNVSQFLVFFVTAFLVACYATL